MVKYVYICSSRFSGSTLLGLLLGSHSRAVMVGELSHLPKNISLNNLCSCGVPVRSCSLWSKVIKRLSEFFHSDLLKNPYKLNLGLILPSVLVDKIHKKKSYKLKRKVLRGMKYLELRYNILFLKPLLKIFDEITDNTFLVYDIIRDILTKDIVVDTSKDYLKAINLYKKKPQNVRIILLTRDGRGVFYSGLKRNYPVKDSINVWKRYYKRCLPLFKKFISPYHILQIKYEDLANNPSENLKKICNFLGIQFEENMLNFTSFVHHVANGNDMRFNKSSVIRLDLSWKQKLSLDQKRYFEKIAGKLNRQLGYV